MDLKTVAKICGHSSFKITEQVYANMLDDTVVDKMAAYEKTLK
jgi:integrase